jgi:hypothetical protein
MTTTAKQLDFPAPRKSTWTSFGGILASIGTVITYIAPWTGIPFLLPIGVGLTAIGQAITGVKARDHKVSDEDAGAK